MATFVGIIVLGAVPLPEMVPFLYKRKMGGCLHCLCVVDYFRGSASVFVWNSWLEICNGSYAVIRNTLPWL